MEDEITTGLRATNDNLRFLVARIQQAQESGSALNLQDLGGLLEELKRGEGYLRRLVLVSDENSSLQQEITEYRRNMEALLQLLPTIKPLLLAEKMRLENQRSHLASTTCWVKASKDAQ